MNRLLVIGWNRFPVPITIGSYRDGTGRDYELVKYNSSSVKRHYNFQESSLNESQKTVDMRRKAEVLLPLEDASDDVVLTLRLKGYPRVETSLVMQFL